MRLFELRTVVAAAAGVAVAGVVMATLAYAPFSSSGITPEATAASKAGGDGTARGGSDTAAAVSALSRLDVPTGPELADARSRAAALDYGPATVDRGSVRSTAGGLVIARRSDGDACLMGRFASSCFYAFRGGGIQPLIQEKRVYDSPQAPFVLMIDGLAMDGVRKVQFAFTDGTVASTAVVDNVFQITKVGGRIDEIVAYTVDGASYPWSRPRASKRTLVLPGG
jgi:hypothetical protein